MFGMCNNNQPNKKKHYAILRIRLYSKLFETSKKKSEKKVDGILIKISWKTYSHQKRIPTSYNSVSHLVSLDKRKRMLNIVVLNNYNYNNPNYVINNYLKTNSKFVFS